MYSFNDEAVWFTGSASTVKNSTFGRKKQPQGGVQ
jgi:hypothetical protein